MSYIQVGQENSRKIDIHYNDFGSGEPIVLIHGWPLSATSWEKQIPALLAAGFRVITYDRRGFGESTKPATGYDYDSLSKDLDTILTKLDLQNVTLIGFSMGGGEVARYLGKYGTARVKKAVFISAITPFLKKTADNPEGVDGKVFDGIQDGLMKDRPAFMKNFFNDFYNAGILNNRISAEAMQSSWNVAVAASGIACYETVTSWQEDFRADLGNVNIPVLTIHGDADKTVPYEASGKRMPSVIKNSKLETIEGAPHGLTWTHAEEVNKILINFLGRSSK